MAKIRLALLVLVGAAMLAGLRGVSAQEPDERDTPPWVQLVVVQVDPAMVDEFLAAQRELMARAKEAGVPWRSVSRTHVFGDTYRFLVATPVDSLATFDDAGESDPEWTRLIHRVERTIHSRQSYAIRTLPDVDHPLPPDRQPGLMVVNLIRVAPGREQEYLDVMREDFLPHFNEADMHHVTGTLALGGEGGFIHVFYVDDFAQLDQGSPVVRALGTDGAQAVSKKLAGIVTGSEIWIARQLPDYSYVLSPEESGGR